MKASTTPSSRNTGRSGRRRGEREMSFIDKEVLKESLRKALERSKKRRFKQTVEMTIVLRDIDPKSPEGRFRETVILPHGRGKDARICVVAEGDMALKAKNMGLPRVLGKNDLQGMSRKEAKKIAEECDWVLVRTDLMPLAGRILGPALGPRGKVPVPVPPNADIGVFVERYKKAVYMRNKDQPQLMVPIGTEDMDPEKLAENAQRVLAAIEPKLRSPTHNIARIIVKTSMGPPVEVPLR